MDLTNPSFKQLFDQLGLASDHQAIDRFIEEHKGLDSTLKLQQAPFWNPTQAKFIEDSLNEDAAWAELIDQLNNRLR
ncbi:DUF2789 family protein [Neptunicella marina]|uniref:DUF2789 domain-containing protein n=1 Tax=Neptunicella marina TaxID=2125989 RepID=A0A8J6LVX4_9ALTE|nr:DUF2789 family protein [Neptunicella marina]MBC3764904.1 DUF2789 domain-containing protein [Neptunicella marina]